MTLPGRFVLPPVLGMAFHVFRQIKGPFMFVEGAGLDNNSLSQIHPTCWP